MDHHLAELSSRVQQELEAEVQEARQFLSHFFQDAREGLALVTGMLNQNSMRSRSGLADSTDASWNLDYSTNSNSVVHRRAASQGARQRRASLRGNARKDLISATGWS